MVPIETWRILRLRAIDQDTTIGGIVTKLVVQSEPPASVRLAGAPMRRELAYTPSDRTDWEPA